MKLTSILLILFSFCWTNLAWTQIRGAKRLTIGKMRDMSRDVGSSAGDMAKEEMQTYEAGLRANVQSAKKDLPGRALGMFSAVDTNPPLSELIEDENAKAAIEDRRNDKRFVDLMYEWWYLPSSFDLAEKRRRAMELLKSKLTPKSVYLHQKQVMTDGQKTEVIVFTWHPTWYTNAYKQYHYNRVNVVSYYSYDIDPISGFPLNPEAIDDFLNPDPKAFVGHVKAHQRIKSYGDEKIRPSDTSYAKVLLSVSLHGEENVRTFLANENLPAQQQTIDEVMALVDSMKIDGIELNILNVPPDRKGEFYKFLRFFSERVHKSRADRLVFLSVPAFDRKNVYDFAELTQYIDYFIVLAMDFQNEIEPDTIAKSPISPLNIRAADQAPDIRTSVERYIRKIGTYNSTRLILALPNYGMMWISQGRDEVPVKRYSFDDILRTYILSTNSEDTIRDTVRMDISRYAKVWEMIDDSDSMNPPIRTEIFFDDIETWRIKYNYALGSRLGGVALHMLGDVSQYSEPFNLLLDEVFAEEIKPENSIFAKYDRASDTTQGIAFYFLAVLLYWGIFMIMGFVWALFDYKTRQALFDSSRFRTLYLAFFVTLLIMLGNYFGLFQYNVALLVGGLALGSFFSWAILKSLYKQQEEQP